MSDLRLYFLGSPLVKQAGEAVTLETRKATALLAYLALTEGAQRREALATLLWPEYEQVRAYANLRRSLYSLKQGIGEHWLAIDADSVALQRDEGWWLDVVTFEAALATAAAHQHDVPALCTICVAALEEAVALYRGDFLAGFTLPDSPAFDEWHFFQSERLRQEAVGALARLVTAHRAQGKLEKAIEQARRWLAFEPLHEPAHRALMRLYAEAGRRAAALRQYEQCVRLLDEEFSLPPEAETIRLYEAIQANQLSPPQGDVAGAPESQVAAPPPQPRHNLPIPLTPFIGREQERAALAVLLRESTCRLLTLTGPGGTGKTRLAIQVATEVVDEFPAGVCWVGLAPLRDPALVIPTILQALGVPDAAGKAPSDQLREAVQSRPGLLLLLDNFEHLPEAAPLLSELLAAPSEVTILVTSREPLHLYGEQEYAVPPFTLPDAFADDGELLARLANNEAATLFVQRAAAIQPGFQLRQDNARAVAELCVRLDGLPLALELAAARIKLFTPQALLARLADPASGASLAWLRSRTRDVPARQRTLRNTIEWSFQLLSEAEQQLFVRMSVFVGGCTLEAVEAVCNVEGDLPDVVEGVLSLLDKSLVRRLNEVAGELRVGMLETIREYATEQLEVHGEAAALRARHLRYYLELAERAERHLTGPHSTSWLTRLEAELPNLRAALAWALAVQERSEAALRLAAALHEVWFIHGYWHEAREWLDKVLAVGDRRTSPARANVLHAAARFAFFQGALDQARPLAEESLAIGRQVSDRRTMVQAMNILGMVADVQGELEQARSWYLEAVELARENLAQQQEARDLALLIRQLGHTGHHLALRRQEFERAVVLLEEGVALARTSGNRLYRNLIGTRGMIAYWQGAHEQAQGDLQESLQLFRQSGHQLHVAFCLLYLGRFATEAAHWEQAATHLQQSLAYLWEVGAQEHIAQCLIAWADLAMRQAQFARATRLLAATQALLERISLVLEVVWLQDHERLVELVRRQLDETSFTAEWSAGRAMTLEHAIDFVLEG